MSQNTRQEILFQMRRRYLRAGRRYKSKLVTELVERFGYHRKAALRALRPKAPAPRAPFARGRTEEYSQAKLLPPLKAIWLAALQPCGVLLKASLPEWLADYQADHRRLDADVRRALLSASRAAPSGRCVVRNASRQNISSAARWRTPAKRCGLPQPPG